LNGPVTGARLLSPSPDVSACVRAYLSRTAPEGALSYFPVNPACALTWFVRGGLAWVRPVGGPEICPGPARVLFSGPHTRPTVTCSPGEVEAFMVLLMPDVLHALTGLEISAWVDRMAPIQAVLGPDWQEMAGAVLAAPDDAARIACLEAFLRPRLGEVPLPAVRRYEVWARRLLHRAQSTGRGVRQVERRVKRWCGLPMRELRVLAHAESLFLQARQAQRRGELDWATLSAQAGYADQPHLCRTTRRVSGLTPTELQEHIETDEAFWVYRIWR
jgi:AraC-like DNA-binding protein